MTTRTYAASFAALLICGCATTNGPNAAGGPAGASTCLTTTGSRIPAGDTRCTAWGRSYSQTDLDQTGKTTAGGALAILDPSVTINH